MQIQYLLNCDNTTEIAVELNLQLWKKKYWKTFSYFRTVFVHHK